MVRVLFAVFALIAFSVPASAADTSQQALQWLERMSNSSRALNYRGTFAFEHGDQMESLRITHAVFNGEEYERLQYLDGDHREILRRGKHLSCFQPGQKLVRFYQQQQNLRQSKQDDQLNHYYDLALLEESRVAGRKVVEVLVTPRDSHRLGYRLAIDKETGLLLRLKLLDEKQAPLERFQFVDVEVNTAIPQDFFRHSSEVVSDDMPESAANPVNYRWQANWLPKGFSAQGLTAKEQGLDMVSYSDGLAAFSVFVEPENQPAHSSTSQQMRRGATVAYSSLIDSAKAPHRVTVVGEIPLPTAQLVAQSVELLQ